MTALFNNADDLTHDALDGLRLLHPDLLVTLDPARVTRREAVSKVALVSGGGSGHEPLHTGFVGPGMLDAAVPGAVFASPTAAQVRDAVRAVDRGRGVLLVVKNYTGDRLNFTIGAELAAEEGIDVRSVLVDDDLATEGTGPGRRGTAAVVAVEKIAGAAAEAGADLESVAALAERVAAGARSLALAFHACTPPGRAEPAFALRPGEIEFGVGIHGERGIEVGKAGPAADLVGRLTTPIVAALGLRAGDRVLAIVNGLGATHGLELAVAHRELTAQLDAAGITVARALVGTYVTALDMAGFSVTLLRCDDELLRLWDAPVRTPAWNW
ncbi:dihydroxyacetone kinase N-terminal domain-containing protein [Streptomyces albus]|uniref:Dihydroxyacetone kinase N-terminal domain-containing protein n=1 Tax=Streptomyces albus (strain ATCC 21838 / DSM 41398 / FERM P-419 / JCM 4703 / NBRC 107858) TaxID=1081613 RepID=A0A0B5EEY1_STRA4|nr:dihydroxyacetone kinase N-terminal domain-containing protein [Streptomyces albus]AOU74855.1 dihydroxyacetone kinase N-terminal domain-containing protein [Streptomyces albus]AYN30664.1 dihydroxyacetone kinase subunit DhaK [Streptomyces albus]